MNILDKIKSWLKHNYEPSSTGNANISNHSNMQNFSGKIIAAKVISIKKHPNADRLSVVKLSDGIQEIYPVICGAKNFGEGDIVALALPGATISRNIHSQSHESFVLEAAKIRGIESQGMICSAFEIGLSEEIGDGIIVLPKETDLGKIIA